MKAKLTDWWRRRRWTSAKFKRFIFFESRGDVPPLVPRQTIAIVGTLERPKWAVFECPCGRRHQITLNLSPSRQPFWSLERREKGVSVRPSVDAYEPYDCHYWIQEGRVRWAPSRGT